LLASAIKTHKLLVSLIIGSLAVSAGVAAAVNQGTLGTLSFTVNSGFNITSLANLNLGTITAGQTVTSTSTATVTINTPGTYRLFLDNTKLLHEVFSSFSVTITGFGNGFVTLDLTHEALPVTLAAGTYTVTVGLNAVVRTDIDHSITVTAVPFLGLSQVTPVVQQTGTETQTTETNSD
jgi:hypothetical protein